MGKTSKVTYTCFVLLGVASLVFKSHYSGPFGDIIQCYGGNVSASFAAYFMLRIISSDWGYGKLMTAGVTLLAVELFEVTNGYG